MTTATIPPSEIQAKLSSIWGSLEGEGKMRASLFNLIFFTKKKARAEYIWTISQKVIEKFPSRILFVTVDDEEKGDYIRANVSVEITNGSGSGIACDTIQIDVAGSYLERVPFVLLPHILPDLPVYVIWAEAPDLNSPLFQELQKLATRMIFDSETVENLSEFASQLLEVNQAPHSEIADLNWGRMESWRNLLTSTFYSPERLEQLKKSKRIQILYNAKETAFCSHTSTEALYLQGWLARQLGWKLIGSDENEGRLTLSYDRAGGKVAITLFPEWQEKIKAGSILSVDLETDDQNHFSFGRDLDLPHHVSMRFSTLVKCDMPLKYIFAKDESGRSLVNEICHKGTSRHYLNLLQEMKNHKEYSFCEH
ncbi:MAG: hypothetical protein KR126chlam1_01037 [Chlamydiae bacterium]|nr:hypothetical protein [Chlamydiota bacterium]